MISSIDAGMRLANRFVISSSSPTVETIFTSERNDISPLLSKRLIVEYGTPLLLLTLSRRLTSIVFTRVTVGTGAVIQSLKASERLLSLGSISVLMLSPNNTSEKNPTL